ncbi:MAG: ATP synthase subunit I [Acidobacteriota bacterium]|nr:ATP synthase subunit I [Acidobacteriota bacterium]
MKQIPDSTGEGLLSRFSGSGIESRIFRTMIFASALAVVASLPFAPWRVTAGLLLGGALSLLNHHWLSRSTTAALSVVAHGTKPSIGLAQYVFRYALLAGVVFAAYKLNVVSLTATIAGLCSFVAALFVEAFRELYFVIIHREETT